MASQNPILSVNLLYVLIIIALNSIHVAQTAPLDARVQSFPGFTGHLSSDIYSKYITVNEAHGRALFYYFVKSEKNPGKDPILLWLTGGPGCSSFNGFIYEIGPLNFDLTGASGSMPKMKANPHSWTKVSNIIFLDSPVGTGFSYSNTTEDYQTGDIKTVSDVYAFLIKRFEEYPIFLSNPVYIGGDSYFGIFVPLVAKEIADGIAAGVKPTLNLKGYMVGNGLTDFEMDTNGKVPFAHGMGLVSDELYQAVKEVCNGSYLNPTSDACKFKMLEFGQTLSCIHANNILDPICFPFSIKKEEEMSRDKIILNSPTRKSPLDVLQAVWMMFGHFWLTSFQKVDGSMLLTLPIGEKNSPCGVDSYQLSNIWANNPFVRKSIHAQSEEITGAWKRCSTRFKFSADYSSVVKYHLELTMQGYSVFIYSGDHDMVVTFIGSQSWLRSLGYKIVDDWRSWFVDGQVAGYTRAYDRNLTFTTIKGAGHTAPEYKPRKSFVMFDRWTSRQPI